MQIPGPRDIVIYWPGPRAFSVVQKPWGWAHIFVQKPRGGGVVTGQIDTCITCPTCITLLDKAPCQAIICFSHVVLVAGLIWDSVIYRQFILEGANQCNSKSIVKRNNYDSKEITASRPKLQIFVESTFTKSENNCFYTTDELSV